MMAFIRVEPVEVQVRTNWFNGRPREITWGDERLPVTRLAVVREEAAAYPVITGPRTLFEVDTPRARLSLIFQHRSRRWTVTGLDESRTRRRLTHELRLAGAADCPPTASAVDSVSGRARRYRAPRSGRHATSEHRRAVALAVARPYNPPV